MSTFVSDIKEHERELCLLAEATVELLLEGRNTPRAQGRPLNLPGVKAQARGLNPLLWVGFRGNGEFRRDDAVAVFFLGVGDELVLRVYCKAQRGYWRQHDFDVEEDSSVESGLSCIPRERTLR